MTFDLAIIAVSERAVQCALEDGSPAFWLPRGRVEWRGALEPGAMVSADIPRWLAQKHTQLIASRVSTQKVLDFHPAGLDPEKATGELPMADALTGRGALFRADKKGNDKAPDYRGDETITLPDGREVKLEIAGWVKEGAKGKYLSLAIKPHRDQQQTEPQRTAPQQQQNTYAQSTSRDDRQRQPAGGPTFGDDSIPFLPDR